MKHKWQVRLERTVVQYIDVYINVEEGYSPIETAIETMKQPLAPPSFGGGKKLVIWTPKTIGKLRGVEIIQMNKDDRPGIGVLDLSIESSRLINDHDE